MLASFLGRGVPMHFGGMSDPFQPAETRHRVTLEFLSALSDYNYPTDPSGNAAVWGVTGFEWHST
jgi:hypothetical protein